VFAAAAGPDDGDEPRINRAVGSRSLVSFERAEIKYASQTKDADNDEKKTPFSPSLRQDGSGCNHNRD
jgi:hypothetical protein